MKVIGVLAVLVVAAAIAGGASALGVLVLEWIARLVVSF